MAACGIGGVTGSLAALDYRYRSQQVNKDLSDFEKCLKNRNEELKGEGTEDKNISDKKGEEDKEDTRTEVLVKPDGSKIMVVTVNIGGIQAVTNMEISRPEKESGSFLEKNILNNFGSSMHEGKINIINQKGDM